MELYFTWDAIVDYLTFEFGSYFFVSFCGQNYR